MVDMVVDPKKYVAKKYGTIAYANYLVQKTTTEVAHMDAHKEISIQQTSCMLLHAYVGENTLHCL
jgi:hypothetical protein